MLIKSSVAKPLGIRITCQKTFQKQSYSLQNKHQAKVHVGPIHGHPLDTLCTAQHISSHFAPAPTPARSPNRHQAMAAFLSFPQVVFPAPLSQDLNRMRKQNRTAHAFECPLTPSPYPQPTFIPHQGPSLSRNARCTFLSTKTYAPPPPGDLQRRLYRTPALPPQPPQPSTSPANPLAKGKTLKPAIAPSSLVSECAP
jgi:hypothetical protein